MQILNQGVVYTDDNCVGCNRCVAECPCPGANISIFENGKNKIKVNHNKCIECGRCLEVCSHGARYYRDDTQYFFSDLEKGKKISLIVSPTFFITYGVKALGILGYLKSLGANKFYSEALGADIMLWAYDSYIKESGDSSFIAHSCSCTVNYIEKCHPALISKLPPVHSANMCTAIYAREYLGDDATFAYITPCLSSKSDIANSGREDLIGYSITFKRLIEHISVTYPDFEVFEDFNVFEAPFVKGSSVLGNICSCPNGFSDSIQLLVGNDRFVRTTDGIPKVFDYLTKYESRKSAGKQLPFIADVMTCSSGCLFGKGTNQISDNDDELLSVVSSLKRELRALASSPSNSDEFDGKFEERLGELDLSSFRREFYSRKSHERHVPEVAIGAVFHSMHKITEESRHIDCHSCGYHSCLGMAKAVALGYANKNSCVNYIQAENRRLFCTDVFTDIPNMNAFSEFCKTILANNHGIGYTAIRFNIRNFSLINKNYGLQAGDDAIKEFSVQASSLAHEDEIVSRISEDNFIALVRNENLKSFMNSLNNIRLHIRTKRDVIEYPVSVYLGVYELEGSDRVSGDVIRKMATTIAAIRRKHDVHVVYFDEAIANDIHKEMSIERMLPEALRNKEFTVYYQPKVRISDQTLIGAEALVRWKKDGKLISPADFIPISEEIGFVRQIDFYVLESVCSSIRYWIDNNIEPVKISVNFSKKHFVGNDVAERITEIVDTYRIPHKLIEVEFTETAYLDGHNYLSETLNKLKMAGISSSIDDFGTGYSSLSLLQDLDFEALKLDKSLLGAKCFDEKNKTVIANVIRMAKELNMQIIAEGVETIDEFHLLRQLSCDAIQGYIFDKPLCVQDFEGHLVDKQYDLYRNYQ